MTTELPAGTESEGALAPVAKAAAMPVALLSRGQAVPPDQLARLRCALVEAGYLHCGPPDGSDKAPLFVVGPFEDMRF